ncbi:MAG: metal ABC transporter ATP-binding protein [Actinomycetota bacterium]|nr:metal ABC transporter ATP-binding protein [Actinomycetota bacterium]
MIDVVIELREACAGYGRTRLWKELNFSARRGEFIAVLGANGTGKTTLLKVLLGLHRLSSGNVQLFGRPPTRGNSRVGYVPQQRSFDSGLPLRGVDLVRMGLDGHRWGIGRRRAQHPEKIHAALELVGATHYAHAPVGLLSGGEQQRLRIAQALVGEPEIILADEPLLSLDPHSQRGIVRMLDAHRKNSGALVIVVTHDINPVRSFVDQVLYLAAEGWAVGPASEVITSESLTRLYGIPVEVLEVRGRVVVVSEYESDLESALVHPHGPRTDRRQGP